MGLHLEYKAGSIGNSALTCHNNQGQDPSKMSIQNEVRRCRWLEVTLNVPG